MIRMADLVSNLKVEAQRRSQNDRKCRNVAERRVLSSGSIKIGNYGECREPLAPRIEREHSLFVAWRLWDQRGPRRLCRRGVLQSSPKGNPYCTRGKKAY